jgi:hypothetical protein
VGTVRQAKLKLEEEIDALKAFAAAVEDREITAQDAGALKEDRLAWQGMAAGTAVGVVVMTALVLIYLRLKR